jgi:hypothetical protein
MDLIPDQARDDRTRKGICDPIRQNPFSNRTGCPWDSRLDDAARPDRFGHLESFSLIPFP